MSKHAIQPIKYHSYFQTISRVNWWFILEIAQNFHRIRRKAAWYAIMKTVNCLITVWNSEEIYSLFSARTSIHEEWRFECNRRKRTAWENEKERGRGTSTVSMMMIIDHCTKTMFEQIEFTVCESHWAWQLALTLDTLAKIPVRRIDEIVWCAFHSFNWLRSTGDSRLNAIYVKNK